MDREFAYYYTRLSDLPSYGRVYVYGIVRSVTDSDFGGQLIKIEDEDGSALVKVVRNSSKYFYDLQVGNILRLHRTEIGSHQESQVLLVDIHNCGCHAVAWQDQSDVPHIATSKHYTLTKSDLFRVAALRKLIATQDEPEAEDGSHAQSIRVEESYEGSSFKKVTDEPVVVEPTPSKSRANKRSRTDENITNARDIPKFGSQFFNWCAQVLGVYTGKGEPFTVFLRLWDGTKPRFPAYRNMFHADKDSIDTVRCEISPSLFSVIEPFTVDVCCYGEWARKALSLRISDVVHLCNVRNYTSSKNGISAVTLHERGLQYGRALEVVHNSDPKHFEISKRCADVLSRYVEPSTQDSSSVVNMTPILPENVLAQSTPLSAKDDATPRAVCECQREPEGPQTGNDFSSDHLDEPTSSQNPYEMLAPNKPEKTLRNAVDGIAEMMPEGEERDLEREPVITRSSRMGSPSPKRKRKSLVTNVDDAVSAELEQNVGESTSQSLHLSESTSMQLQQKGFSSQQRSPTAISASSPTNRIIDSEKSRPPDEQAWSTKCGITEDHIRNQSSAVREEDFLSALEEDELFENADADVTLVNEIRDLSYKSKLKKKLEKVEKLAAPTYELKDELGEILKQEIGDRICLVNSVEASLTTMEELDYLRHAIIFTANCLICNNEFVVEKATNTWCVKCFSERKRLSQVVHSYRITVPCVYLRGCGKPGQLLLEVAREIWANFPSGSNLFSDEQIMELYLEKDLKKFVPRLNHMVRFAKAVVKTRVIHVLNAKIHAMCKTSGSLTLFVDKCEFKVKNI